MLVCVIGEARGQGKAPADEEIAQAIAQGRRVSQRGAGGSRRMASTASSLSISLGMTALAGLALLENGVARDAREISKAREIVTTLARESNQTYDLALAILFLARCQQTRTGHDDSLIQSLGRRLAHGDHAGIWDYSVPRSSRRRRRRNRRARGAAAAGGRRGSIAVFRRRGRQLEHAVCASGPLGGRPARVRFGRERSNRSTVIFVRPSFAMDAGDTGSTCKGRRPCRAPG